MREIVGNRDIRNGQAFTKQMGLAHQCGTKTGQVQLFQSMVAEASRSYCSCRCKPLRDDAVWAFLDRLKQLHGGVYNSFDASHSRMMVRCRSAP